MHQGPWRVNYWWPLSPRFLSFAKNQISSGAWQKGCRGALVLLHRPRNIGRPLCYRRPQWLEPAGSQFPSKGLSGIKLYREFLEAPESHFTVWADLGLFVRVYRASVTEIVIQAGPTEYMFALIKSVQY